jgi:pectate lyase
MLAAWLMAAGPWTARAADEPAFTVQGFASIPAHGLETTTGGGAAPVTVVRTAQEFLAAAERTDVKDKKARDRTPRIIRVANDIDLGELANLRAGLYLKRVGIVRVRSHTTIFAAGAGAVLRRGTLELKGAANVIIRNLRFRDLWEYDATGEYDSLDWDYVRITGSGASRSHHVWVDHCEFDRAGDGAIDITHGSDLVTVSWCRFGGDAAGPHKKVMLIGGSSSSNAAAADSGRLNVTLHHNVFQNIMDRAPRARFGNVHAFNNLVDGAENATISVMKAVTLVENCVYRDARVATTFSHAADSAAAGRAGTLVIVNSRNENPRLPAGPPKPAATPGTNAPPDAVEGEAEVNEAFELAHNFESSIRRDALEFNPPADWAWPNRRQLPYRHRLDPVEAVPDRLARFAGAGRLPAHALPARP